MKLKIIIVILLINLLFGFVKAQDIHFSQYNTSPLTLNPALTGFYNGDYRLTLNYRSQWGSIGDPYRTLAASFEISVFKGKLKNDYLGIGISFFNDKSGEIELGTNQIALSAAYRKTLGGAVRKKHALLLGVQTALITQKLNPEKLIFDSQYNGITPDPSAPSGENISSNSNAGFDLNVGLLYHVAPNNSFNFFAGGAYHHILQPGISFLANSDYKLQPKYTGHLGAKINLNRIMNLLPSAAFFQQGKARQISAGTYLQFILNDNDWESLTAFSLGAWTRVASPKPDAVIIGARMDYWNFVLSMSYDVNISSLTAVSNSRGAYEISLIYVGQITTRGQRSFTIPCPQL